jgi:hypothetical protein
MLAAERNVQHLTKNAPAAANDRNEFRFGLLRVIKRLADRVGGATGLHP